MKNGNIHFTCKPKLHESFARVVGERNVAKILRSYMETMVNYSDPNEEELTRLEEKKEAAKQKLMEAQEQYNILLENIAAVEAKIAHRDAKEHEEQQKLMTQDLKTKERISDTLKANNPLRYD